jgi:hypothetical protein
MSFTCEKLLSEAWLDIVLRSFCGWVVLKNHEKMDHRILGFDQRICRSRLAPLAWDECGWTVESSRHSG